MDVSDLIQYRLLIATIIGLFITVISLFVTIYQFKKQLKLNFFSEYTKRYQEIILNFPENINSPDFDFTDLDTSSREKTLRYMRAYFDLCSEEYFLNQSGSIDSKTWENWKQGIEYALSKKAFRDAWGTIQFDTKYYPDFSEFVKKTLKSNKSV